MQDNYSFILHGFCNINNFSNRLRVHSKIFNLNNAWPQIIFYIFTCIFVFQTGALQYTWNFTFFLFVQDMSIIIWDGFTLHLCCFLFNVRNETTWINQIGYIFIKLLSVVWFVLNSLGYSVIVETQFRLLPCQDLLYMFLTRFNICCIYHFQSWLNMRKMHFFCSITAVSSLHEKCFCNVIVFWLIC